MYIEWKIKQSRDKWMIEPVSHIIFDDTHVGMHTKYTQKSCSSVIYTSISLFLPSFNRQHDIRLYIFHVLVYIQWIG